MMFAEKRYNEEIVYFGTNHEYNGILTQPVGANNYPLVVFLNAGMIHKVGPNRLYVHLARKLAEIGFPSFRFDLSGIGDSSTKNSDLNFYDLAIGDTKMVLSRFINKKCVLIGLCTGADISFNVALKDERVIAIATINGGLLEEKEISNINYTTLINKRYYKKNLFSTKHWLKVLSGRSKIFRIKNILLLPIGIFAFLSNILRRENSTLKVNLTNQVESDTESSIIKKWSNLIDRKVSVFHIFSEGSKSLDVFRYNIEKRLQKINNNSQIMIEIIKDVDHTFTHMWSHNYLINLICEWLKKQLK